MVNNPKRQRKPASVEEVMADILIEMIRERKRADRGRDAVEKTSKPPSTLTCVMLTMTTIALTQLISFVQTVDDIANFMANPVGTVGGAVMNRVSFGGFPTGGKVLEKGDRIGDRFVVTSPVGNRIHPIYFDVRFHYGIDLAPASGVSGDPLHNPAPGKTTWTCSYSSGGGNIAEGTVDGYLIRLLHLQTCTGGDSEVIGKLGNTGGSTGPHLHMEVYRNGTELVTDITHDMVASILAPELLQNKLNPLNWFSNGGGKVAPQAIYQGLQQRGMSSIVAAGFVGNIGQESGFKPDIENGIGAYGLVQWLDGRRTRLEQFSASTGRAPSDLEAQLDFIIHELQGTESAAWKAIKQAEATGDLAYVTEVIARRYERMGEHEIALDNRIAYAEEVYGR
ncbi:MAG: M23 family metallopeptidase [Leptolyngbya sp. SIOISBB]|nr:M23 family metallopeptidase [Leptolyngbya sp. SIOISBB]